MSPKRLISVDPSLTSSGWALFCTISSSVLAVGKIRSLPPKLPLASRLEDLQRRIEELYDSLKISNMDVLVCESPTTMRDPRAAFKVEQVRGIFESLARRRGACVPGRINPRSVQFEIVGLKGKQLERPLVKKAGLFAVQALYGDDLRKLGFALDEEALEKHQDIVDAMLIGRLGLSRIQAAKISGERLEEVFNERPHYSRRRVAR